MGKYVVSKGQNLYDVALHLYGSIEGIVDLFIHNELLSFCDVLTPGTVLLYTDDYVIDEGVFSYNRMHNIVPANGEQRVYVKEPSLPLVAYFFVANERRDVGFSVRGRGKMEVDWGDNSPLLVIDLSERDECFHHYFDNSVSSLRRVRLYGDFVLNELDVSLLSILEARFLHPFSVERFTLTEGHLSIDFLSLLTSTYEVDLSLLVTDSLLPLVDLTGLMQVDLTKGRFKVSVLDDYLISLVQRHGNRRSCTVMLSCSPSGSYEEPAKDGNNRYILTSGMEAIWVLTHEPAWNEAGFWKFIINDEVYMFEG